MLRFIAWLLLAAYLLIVGLWPAAVTPVEVVFHGLGILAAVIPGPALIGLAAYGYFRHRPATA